MVNIHDYIIFPYQFCDCKYSQKLLKSEIELGLPFMFPDIVYKFQIIPYAELKLLSAFQMSERCMDMGKTWSRYLAAGA